MRRRSRPATGVQGPPAQDSAAPVALVPATASLFVVLFAIYAWTACRTVGPGDSGELAVVMSTWGVAHAPGYPLLVLIGNLVAHLPHPGEPAFALNLLNAAFAALACSVLALAVATTTGRTAAGWVAGFALGTSQVFWDYALVVEVFALNALFAALLLYVVAHWLAGVERGAPPSWAPMAAAGIATTCLTHHATLVLLAGPAFLVMVGVLRRRGWAGVAGAGPAHVLTRTGLAFLAGLLPLAYIPIAAHFDPPLNWGDVSNAAGLWRSLVRADFGSGWLAPPVVLVGQILEHGERASPFGLRHLGIFLADVPRSFGWAFPILSLIGLAWVARDRRPLLWLVLLFSGLVLVFFSRVNTPVVPLHIGVTQRFYILPHVVLAFLGGLGIASLTTWSARRHARGPLLVVVLVAAGTALVLPRHWSHADMSGNTFVRDFGANLIAGMPEGAIVFTSGDLFSNSFAYQQIALRRRTDLEGVDQNKLAVAWYVAQLRRRGRVRLPEGMVRYTGDPAFGSKAWLDANRGNRSQLTVGFVDDTYRDGYRLLPRGLWSEVRPVSEPVAVGALADVCTEAVSGWATASIDGPYRETSWERSEGAFYTYALAQLAALRAMSHALDPSTPATPEPAALALAARWQGERRAAALAYQAETWRTGLADSLFPAGSRAESLAIARVRDLARASLAIDPDHLQALQTLVALMSEVPALGDASAELAMRREIVRQRPGIESELEPYVKLAMQAAGDSAAGHGPRLAEAEAARRRFVSLLDLCLRISDDAELVRLRGKWSAPLGSRTPHPSAGP